MSEPYSRFYALINTYGLGQYWDQVEHELDTKGLSRGLSTMSSGGATHGEVLRVRLAQV